MLCAGFDWDHPSPLRHLELTLAKDHRLVHLESLGLRRPRLAVADLRRLVWKAGRGVGLVRPRFGGGPVTVVGAVGVPLYGHSPVRAFNARWLMRTLRPALPGRPDLFLTSLPSAVDLLELVDARVSAYYRVDDWPQWPGIDADVVTGLERRLMDRVDLSFCTSRALLDRTWSRNGRALHLPQGVDLAHFARGPGPVHPRLAGIPHPVIGFLGTLDDRLDVALLRNLTARWRGSVVLAGARARGAPRLPRGVQWIGHVPYEELAQVTRAVDVWMLPYVVGSRTDAIDPLKLREYLATGLPVVSTPLPEVRRWSPHVVTAASPDEFVRTAARVAASPEQGRVERLASLVGHTWDDRRRTFLDAVADVSGAMLAGDLRRTGRAIRQTMPGFTLIVGERTFKLARVDTLRELINRKLISTADFVLQDGASEPVTVARMLEREESEPTDPSRSAAPASVDDLWDAWDDTDSFPVDDLVSRMLQGHSADGEGDEFTSEESSGSSPRGLERYLSDSLPPSDDGPVSVEELPDDAIAEMIESPAAADSPVVVETLPDERPHSFVEYVQQRRATTNLQIHEEEARLVSSPTRSPIGMWPFVIGAGALVVFGLTYFTVRSGAERTYPTESEVRLRLSGQSPESEATPARDVTNAGEDGDDEAPTVSVPDTAERREIRLRSEIPVPLRPFRNVETFRDALFTDLTNSDVPIREIRVDALVLAPTENEFRRRPEEVNVELRLAPEEGETGEDSLAKTFLVLGHYGADAHVRLRRIVVHIRAEAEMGTVFEIEGENAVAFFEGKMDLKALTLDLERRTGSDYLIEVADEDDPGS